MSFTMQTPELSLKIVAADDRFRPCVEYVFRSFARAWKCDVQVVSQADQGPAAEVTIFYDQAASNLPASVDPGTGRVLRVFRSSFFSEGTDEGWGNPAAPDDLPRLVALAKSGAFDGAAQRSASNHVTLPLDIVASAFYLLTGYFDWASAHRDSFGRVLSTYVPVPAETWDLPVVNHWFRQLHELLGLIMAGQDKLPEKPLSPPAQQTICLTHDVDLLQKYCASRTGRGLLRAVTSREKVGAAFNNFKRSILKSGSDPYDSFDALYTVKERIGAPSTFFFLGSGPSPQNGDYHPDDRQVRELYTRARSFGDETALHGSWNSVATCKTLAAEKSALSSASRATIRGNRQHYLRFENPETWKCVASNGMNYDSSGGFPDRAGFKYGWSGCFQPFDLDAMQPLPLVEIPLVCMDVTIANYEKIPAELSLERLTNLLDAACDDVPGGAFVFLWHNILADREEFPGYWDTFEYFFSVASGSARFITLEQLCDEYGAVV